jgi:hypothetical protein
MKNINSGIEGAIENKTKEIISLLDEGLIGDTFSGSVNVSSLSR